MTTQKNYIAFSNGLRFQGTLISENGDFYVIFDTRSQSTVTLPKLSTVLQEVRE